jgi:hypothetical protein
MNNNIKENKTLSYNNMESGFLKIWAKDTNPNKPKILKRGGVATKKAIAYNKKLINEGKTNFFIKPNTLYNPITKRETTSHIDKRSGTKTKKSFLKNNVAFQGITMTKKQFLNKSTGIQKTFRMPELNTISPTTFSNEQSLNNNLLLEQLTKNLKGNYRIIIKRGNQSLIDKSYKLDDRWFTNNETEFILSGSPVFMVWNGQINDVGDVVSITAGTEITFIITKENKLPFAFYAQTYKHGITNCLLTPIKDYFITMMKNSKTKQGKNNFDRFIRYTDEFIEKFKNGVPEKMIDAICEKLKVSIEIVQPFTNMKYLQRKASTRSQKRFKFINTSMDHVDVFNDDVNTLFKANDPIVVSAKEMMEIQNELDFNDEMYIFKKNLQGLSAIRTLTKNYTLGNDFYDIKRQFEDETGLRDMQIDAFQDPELQTFINDAVSYNGTVDFKDTSHLRHISKTHTPPENLEHIDMMKAYSKFYESEYYQGFAAISHFRKMTEAKYNGYYYIDSLNLLYADKKFKRLNKVLGWFKPNNIYTLPELKALEKHGGKYTITHGAIGTKDIDFRFNKDMLESKEKVLIPDGEGSFKEMEISYYAKYCGIIASLHARDNFFMKGNKKFLQTIQQDDDLEIYYSDYDNESRITFNKKYMNNKKYITGQITAYQRLNMLEQLLKMDLDKIVRVCVDGIYYEKHDFENKADIINETDKLFRDKSNKMTFQNHPAEEYLSNILSENDAFDRLKECKFKIPISRDIVKFELNTGAGGTGKSHYNLITDRGLVNAVYVAPTHKLASEMYEKIFNETGRHIPCIVLHRILEEPFKIQERYIYKWRHYLIDECSMITEGQKNELMQTLPNAIFMGDIEHQLKPVVDIQKLRKRFKDNIPKDYLMQMTDKGFDKVKNFTKNYRFKDCNRLLRLSNFLRENKEKIIDYKKLGIKSISINELKNIYKKEDIILRFNNELKTKTKINYTEMFKDIPKYKITSNYSKYKNGEIIYEDLKGFKKELRHAFTVHSVQGITFEENIFIDIEKFDYRLFYTAISRARKKKQLYIINND